MSIYNESSVVSDGCLFILKRISLGCYDVYHDNMLAFEAMDANHEQYNNDTRLLVREIKRLRKIERDEVASANIKSLEVHGGYIGEKETKVMMDLRLKYALDKSGVCKKLFINEAVREKLEKEGLLW